MRLEQSRLAQADVQGIFEYSLLHHGAERALAYLDHIERCFRQLQAYPRSGRIEPRFPGIAHSISCEEHRVYYDLTDNMIFVLRVLHKSTDVAQWIV